MQKFQTISTYSDSDVMLPLCVRILTAMRCRGDFGEREVLASCLDDFGKLSTLSGGTRTSRLPAETIPRSLENRSSSLKVKGRCETLQCVIQHTNKLKGNKSTITLKTKLKQIKKTASEL